MRDHVKLLRAEALHLGAENLRIVWKGRHPSFVGIRPDGSPFRMVISGTPSCPRTVLNERSRLRRVLSSTAKEH